MLQKNVPAFQSALGCCFCTSLCGLRQLPLGPCLVCTSPSFFFFPYSRKTQSTFSWILLTQPFMQASKLSFLCQGIMVKLSGFFKNIPIETELGTTAGMDGLETWPRFGRQLLRMRSCVVSSSCSCPMSLQKHSTTISGPKAKNAPFNRNWLHQFYLKSQSLLHKQNPKSSGKYAFPSSVLLFFQQ